MAKIYRNVAVEEETHAALLMMAAAEERSIMSIAKRAIDAYRKKNYGDDRPSCVGGGVQGGEP